MSEQSTVTVAAPKAKITAYYEHGELTSLDVELANDELTVEELCVLIDRLAQPRITPSETASPGVEAQPSVAPLMPAEPVDPLGEPGPSGPGVQLMSSAGPAR